MSKTKQELMTEVLQNVGSLAAGQAPSAEDADLVNGRIDTVLANLNGRGILGLGDTNSFDNAVFDLLAIIVAQWVGPAFGAPRDMTVILNAEYDLKVIGRPEGVSDLLRTDPVLRAGSRPWGWGWLG